MVDYVVVVVLLAAGIYAFLEVVGFRTRLLTGKSTKTAESMYDSYADSPGKQKRYARRRSGEWRDEETGRPTRAARLNLTVYVSAARGR